MLEKKKHNYVEYVVPFIQLGSIGGVGKIDAYRCMQKLKDGSDCKRVALSYEKIILHLAVEHGVRPANSRMV